MKASTIQKTYTELAGVKAKKLPVKMSFILSRNLKKMEEVVQDIDGKRNDLLGLYGEKDKDGKLNVGDNGQVHIVDPDKFMSELTEVLNADIEITLDKVSMSDVEKCDQDGYDALTVEEVGALEIMLEDSKE